MALTQQLLRNLKGIVLGAIGVAANIVAGIIEAIGWLIPLGAILIGTALLLIILRDFFLETIPFLKPVSSVLCDSWDLVVVALKYIKEVWDFVFEMIEDLVKEIDDTVPGIDLSSVIDGLEIFRSLFFVPGSLSADETNRWLQNILDTCVNYDDAWGVITRLIHYYTHADACALARYVYPVPWLYNMLDPILSWFYSGASDPVVDHYAVAGHHNCENSVGDGEPLDVTCSILGAGFVLLDVILPVFAVLLLLVWCGRPLLRIITSALSILFLVAAAIVEQIFKKIIG